MGILIRILQGVLPLVLLGLAALAAVTMIRNRPVVETQPPQIAPPGVRVHVVALEDLDLAVTSEGTVSPRTESQLVPEISGRVTSIAPSFAEGGFFEEGDVLFTIDPFDYQQAVISARAQLAQTRLRLAKEKAEAEVARREWEELGRGDPRELTLRKPQLEDARAAVAAAEASLVRAERDLERAQIRAPYAGRVRRKNVDVGQFVTVGNSIGTIYAVDVAEIRLPLPDEELAYLNLPLSYRGAANRRGPRVTVRTAFAGATYAWDGHIVRTESEIDPVSRMVHVVAEVRDPYGAGQDPDRPPLAVGMYVDAEIEGRRFTQVAVLPRAAMRRRDQVMIVDAEDRLLFRQVGILRTTAQFLYVDEGLENGERVVISTIDGPTDGMLVQIIGDRLARREAEAPELLSPPPSATPNAAEAEQQPPPANPEPHSREPTPHAPSPTAAPNAVAVLPFTDLSQQAADAELGAALAGDVSQRLDDSGAMSVVPAATSASWVVGGTVQQQDDAVSVTAWVVETANGNIVDTIRVNDTAAELARIRDDVARAVAARLTESLGDMVSATPRAAAAPAPPAPRPAPVAEAAPDQVRPPARAAVRVAVRPFANLSQESGDDSLAVGIGAAVAEYLTQRNTLRVVFSEDDADWIVVGGLQRVGDTVRITARLVDARAGSVVRAVKVDGPVSDVMRLLDEVASAMSAGLSEAVSVAS